MPTPIPALSPSYIRADVALLTGSLTAFALLNTPHIEVTEKTVANIARLYPHSRAPHATEPMFQLVDHILHSVDLSGDMPVMCRDYDPAGIVAILVFLGAIPSYFAHDAKARALIGV